MTRRSTIEERTRVCPVCQTPFLVEKPSRPQRYCGHRCAFAVIGPVVREKAYTPETIAKHAASRRDRGAGISYRKVGGRHEHRTVAEEKIGRALRPEEVVHHCDGTKRNNHPDNIEVMLRTEHSRMHSLEMHRRKSNHENH